MHLLVTGSSGLIGTATVDAATARGDAVTRLVRRSSAPATGTPPAGVTDVTWDPDAGHVDLDALAATGPVDGVVHLAGAGVGDKRWNPARKRVIVESRTRGTDLLARTVALHLRTGIVLSPTGGALAKQLPLFRLGVGGRIGSGRQYRSWITLDDEVRAILHCLDDAELSGAVNATAPSPATDAELAASIGAALHRPAVLPVPAVALKVALGPEMATDMVLASQRAVPSRLTATGFVFRHADLDEAVRSVLART